MDAYETAYGTECPVCGYTPTLWCHCSAKGCADGWVVLQERGDLVMFDPDRAIPCEACHGTGLERFCPNCGADLGLTGVNRLPEAHLTLTPDPDFRRRAKVAEWAGWITVWLLILAAVAAVFYLAFFRAG